MGTGLIFNNGGATLPVVRVPRPTAALTAFDSELVGVAGLQIDAVAGIGAAVTTERVFTVAAVCGLLAAARQRRGPQRARVALGPKGGCWYEYKFRAKPGDKFKFVYSTDKYTPEFGCLPEAKGRVIRYGILLNKGKAMGATRYAQKIANDKNAAENVQGRGALLIDCDGTIVETERDGHRVAFNRAFKQKGFNCEWEVGLYGELLTTGGGKERMTRYFKDYNPGAWKETEPPEKDHPVIKELHKLKTQIFMDIVRSGELSLREGIEELVTAADAAGWAIAVCSTSNEESVKSVVETLLPEFAPSIKIFAGDCVKAKKPAPDIYQLASKELGVAPMKCIVIEDTKIGMESGKAAGMKVIVTKSIYSEDEDFENADLLLTSAAEVDFTKDVFPMLPTLQLA